MTDRTRGVLIVAAVACWAAIIAIGYVLIDVVVGWPT
jgi:hypothetical protein